MRFTKRHLYCVLSLIVLVLGVIAMPATAVAATSAADDEFRASGITAVGDGGYIFIDVEGCAAKLGTVLTVPVKIACANNLGGFKIYLDNNVDDVTLTINESSSLMPLNHDYDINTAVNRSYQVVSWATSDLTGISGDAVLFYVDILPVNTTELEIPVSLRLVEIFDADGNNVTCQYQVHSSVVPISTIEEIKNTVASGEWSAVTDAEIVYELHPYHISLLSSPVIEHGPSSILPDTVSVTKYIGGTWVEVSSVLEEDGSVTIGEKITDSSAIHVSFAGRKLGDVTGDGKVNTGDKIRLGQFVAEKLTLDAAALFYADITGDGKVNTGDKIRMGQYVAEKLTPYYKV